MVKKGAGLSPASQQVMKQIGATDRIKKRANQQTPGAAWTGQEEDWHYGRRRPRHTSSGLPYI